MAASPRWRPLLGDREFTRQAGDLTGYLDVLAGAGCRVDAWETTYLHILAGANPVVEWVKGTALRPVLSVLDQAQTAEFLAEYADRMARAYPPRPFGTVLPFRRVFVVAQRPTDHEAKLTTRPASPQAQPGRKLGEIGALPDRLSF